MGVFVGFSRIFLLGILIFEGLTARRLYKSFGVKGLKLLLCDETKKKCSCKILIHCMKPDFVQFILFFILF
jgi:hypothetical protein